MQRMFWEYVRGHLSRYERQDMEKVFWVRGHRMEL